MIIVLKSTGQLREKLRKGNADTLFNFGVTMFSACALHFCVCMVLWLPSEINFVFYNSFEEMLKVHQP